MQAAILVETGKPLVVDAVALPEQLEYGQVLVRVHASGICGSQIGEIDAVKGPHKFLPHLLGHDGGGVVEEVGPGVRHVRKGDRVVLHWRKGAGIEAPTPSLLDAYTRSDVLKNDLNYDNSAFLQQLEDLSFYVVDCSQSNYPATNLSITSMFYANYHEVPTLTPLYTSLVIETVRSLGYKVITFENYFKGHFEILEDVHLSRNQMALGQIDMTGGLSGFEMLLLKTSALRIIYDMPQLIPGLDENILREAEYYEHYQQVNFILDKLQQLPEEDGPMFVFAHLIIPHDPFIILLKGLTYVNGSPESRPR